MIQQAIITKVLPPTAKQLNHRIVARCGGKRIIVSWQDDLGTEGNHVAARQELVKQLNWPRHGWYAGVIYTGDFVHVLKGE